MPDPTPDPTPNPTIVAASELIGESLDAMRAAIAGAEPGALNWRPGEDANTNTLAVLAVHSMNSTRWWLSVAMGAPAPERDRPSEFRASAGSADELVSFCDEMSAASRSLLETPGAFDAGAMRRSRLSSDEEEETVTAAWALLHALEHLREHVAHAQLTRQLWDMQQIG